MRFIIFLNRILSSSCWLTLSNKKKKRLPPDVFDTLPRLSALKQIVGRKMPTLGVCTATLKRRSLPNRTRIRAKNWPVSSLYYIPVDRARGASWLLG